MKQTRFSIYMIALLATVCLFGGCMLDSEVDYREPDYGYVQFKLYKEASYEASPVTELSATRAIKPTLDYLSEAYKIKVTLKFEGTTLAQTLNLSAADEETAEFGLRSDKLKLLVGNYNVVVYSLYDNQDQLLYTGSPKSESSFTVIPGGLHVHDLTANVTPRGKVRFTLKKDMSGLTRAVDRTYTFDEIKYVNLTVAKVLSSGSISNPTTFESLPAKFSMHFDEKDEVSDKEGYRTSSSLCDTLLSLPVGKYRITAYSAFDTDKSLLETNNNPPLSEFEIEDNVTTEADAFIKLYESDEYIKDYYALREIWEALGGENWYYVGESYATGTNWDFNRDPDLWGDQPGVWLHSNGRVARLDLSNFGINGHMPAAIKQLTQLVELYLGTHNDDTTYGFDSSIPMDQSLAERNRNRMENNRKYLASIHPATQFSEPCARALIEKGIRIPATELYDSLSEKEILNPQTGEQRQLVLMDTNHGNVINHLKSLPKEIGVLKNLEYLYIANCAIESLPEEVAQLESCTDLEIYNCPYMKDFPVAIAQMPELISINISNNAQWSEQECYKGMNALATGASKEKIQILYARQNKLAELPESFSNMKKLGLLDLAYNKIAKIHPLGKDVGLVQLYLDNNELTEIPSVKDADGNYYFCGYNDIETFSIRNNKLTKFPNIFSAKSLYTIASIDLSGNEIDGFEGENETDPEKKFKGVKVQTLTLAQNPKLTKYPKCLADTNSLVSYIILRGCNIREVPAGSFTYKNSVDLMSLDLSYNKLTDLPKEMHAGNLPYLYGVELSFNSFSKFPYEPLDSSGLTVFAVRSQRNEKGDRCLTEWPTGIGNHTGLRALYLGSNNIGVVNDYISYLIYYLDISDNPNIVFDASDICYNWMSGVYFLIYDKTQDIRNCSYMLE